MAGPSPWDAGTSGRRWQTRARSKSGARQFERQAWGDAYRGLTAADAADTLELEDLERLALAAYLVGRPDETIRAWERAHHAAVAEGQPARGVRCAFHLMMGFGQRGEMAQAGGWHARAAGILDAEGYDVVERATSTSRRP